MESKGDAIATSSESELLFQSAEILCNRKRKQQAKRVQHNNGTYSQPQGCQKKLNKEKRKKAVLHMFHIILVLQMKKALSEIQIPTILYT